MLQHRAARRDLSPFNAGNIALWSNAHLLDFFPEVGDFLCSIATKLLAIMWGIAILTRTERIHVC
jgi:hypothetical protein